MPKNITRQRKPDERNFAPKSLGASKADKFALVEGIALNARSQAASALTRQRGLSGDAYREAITGIFRDKRGK